MNKKKRALALGLAATQLGALSAIVAPLTAVTAFADDEATKTNLSSQCTFDVYTVADDGEGNETETQYTGDYTDLSTVAKLAVYVTLPAPGTDQQFTDVTIGDDSIPLIGEGEEHAGTHKVEITDLSSISSLDDVKTAVGAIEAYVLTKVDPFGAAKLNVDLSADFTEADAENAEKADAVAQAIEEAVKAVVADKVKNVLADGDYTVTVDTSDMGNISAVFELVENKGDKKAYVDLKDGEESLSAAVSVTWKTEAQKTVEASYVAPSKALSVTGKDAAAVKTAAKALLTEETLKSLVNVTEGSNKVADTNYTVVIKDDASNPADDGSSTLTYTLTVALTKDAQESYTFANGAEAEVEVTVSYVIKAEVGVTVDTDGITGETAQLEWSLMKGDTKVNSGDTVTEDDELVLTVSAKDGYEFEDDNITVTVGGTEKPAEADGSYKITVGNEALTIAISGKIQKDSTPYPVTLPASATNYKVEMKYTDGDGNEQTTIPSEGLTALTEITITVTAEEGYKLFSANLGEETKTSTNGAPIEFTYTVKASATENDLTGKLEVKTKTIITPSFAAIDAETASLRLTKTTATMAATALDAADKAAVEAKAKSVLTAAGLSDGDYTLAAGAVKVSDKTVTVTFALADGRDADYELQDGEGNKITELTIDVPVLFVPEYGFAADTIENATVSFTDEEGNALTKSFVGGKVKVVVTPDANYSIKTAPVFTGLAFEKNTTTGAWTSTTALEIADSHLDTDADPNTIKLDVTADAVPVFTVVKGTITEQQLTATTKFDDTLKAADVTALEGVLKADGALTITTSATTDVTAADVLAGCDIVYKSMDTETKKVVFTVKAKAESATFDLADTDIEISVKFAKKQLDAPTASANVVTVPASSTDDVILALLKEEITATDDVKTVCDVTVAKDENDNDTAGDTEYEATVTYTISGSNGDDYTFIDTENGDAEVAVATVKVKYKLKAAAVAVTPDIVIKDSVTTVYVTAAPTPANIQAALGADGVTAEFTGMADGEEGPVKDTDYTLDCTYEAGVATFTLELTPAGMLDYKLSGGTTTKTVNVKQILTLPSAPAKMAFTTATANAKGDVETAVAEAIAAAWTGIDSSVYTVTAAAVDVSAPTDETQTVAVTVALTGIYVFDDQGAVSGTINVSYDVTQAVVKNAVTIPTPTNGTVTADKATAAEGEKVTLTITPDPGFKKDTVVVKDASDNDVPVAADGSFTMPATAVTVTVTFVEGTDTPAETEYKITVTQATGGTITASKTKATKGTQITLTATPASGYTFGGWVVKQGSTAVTVTSNKFTMPEGNVTVTASFTKSSSSSGSSGSSGGSYRPSGGSSSGSSSSYTTNSEISSSISSAKAGETVKVDGNTYIYADVVKSAADSKVNLEVKVNSTFTWVIDAQKLTDTSKALTLTVSSAAVDTAQTAKIEKTPGVTDKNEMSFTTAASNLGTGAKLTISTSARSTAAVTQFANLYRTKADGTLEFVGVAPIDAFGSATLPIGDAGTYTVVVSTETKMIGDVDNDCRVSIADVSAQLKRFVDAPRQLTRGDGFKLDHNNDNKFTISDVSALLRFYVNGGK